MIMLDTSVLIDLPAEWPDDERFACSIITFAELQSGIQRDIGLPSYAQRQARLTLLDAIYDWAPFDGNAARGYGTLAAIVSQTRPNHARSKDILIAGHADSMGASLMTRNPKDFELIASMVEIIAV